MTTTGSLPSNATWLAMRQHGFDGACKGLAWALQGAIGERPLTTSTSTTSRLRKSLISEISEKPTERTYTTKHQPPPTPLFLPSG